MARNKVQFQKGLSEVEFERLYGTEELCRAALEKWHWPNGFICPACDGREHHFINTRGLYQCSECHHQASLTELFSPAPSSRSRLGSAPCTT
jgi:Transposase zinc-ribbon domain